MSSLQILSHNDLKAELVSRGLFDARWYTKTYLEHETDEQALDSYVQYGRLIGHHPSSEFDPAFYRKQYLSRQANIPEIDHYICVDDNRPTSASQIEHSLDARLSARGVTRKHRFEKSVSYCIPIQNRLQDLQISLRENLESNRKYEKEVEFVIGIFDKDNEAEDWLKEHFEEDLQTGYLRYFRSDILDVWHFPRAKNAFRGELKGAVHSSLDGDNFVSEDETALILQLWKEHGDHFVLHSFSGEYGDGTCGRVTTSFNVYQAVGYDEDLLSTQYDDISCILRSLHAFPWIPLITFAGEKNILTTDQSEFLGRQANLNNSIVFLDRPTWRPPANPKGEAEVSSNEKVRAKNHLNSLCTWKKLIPDEVFHVYFDHNMRANFDWLIAISEREALYAESFSIEHAYFRGSEPSTELTAILCVKDQESILTRQIDHMRRRGVERFLIVDDHSSPPLSERAFGPDVHIFVPKTGRFRTSKKLWIETLAKTFVKPGSWVLITDADEFVELPEEHATFANFFASLPAGQTFVPGILIDVVDTTRSKDRESYRTQVETQNLHYCANTSPPTDEYVGHSSIKWGFENHARTSWTFDTRHHLVHTYDCLRKVPLFVYDHYTHIHHGFHVLYDSHSETRLGPDWLDRAFVILRHEKLIQYDLGLDPNVSNVETALRSREAENRKRLTDPNTSYEKIEKWLKPYSVSSVYDDVRRSIEDVDP